MNDINMTVEDLLKALKDVPLDTKLCKWNTNYGWTGVSEIKYVKFEDGSTCFSIM